MESLADAARRLLAKLDARRAREIERSGSTVVQSAGIRTAPDAGDDTGHKIATGKPTPRVFEDRDSAKPLALGREADRFPRPFASRPSGAQVAANDNRAHAKALAIARRWLHSAQSADVAKLSRQ